jgi:hypothetical protein
VRRFRAERLAVEFGQQRARSDDIPLVHEHPLDPAGDGGADVDGIPQALDPPMRGEPVARHRRLLGMRFLQACGWTEQGCQQNQASGGSDRHDRPPPVARAWGATAPLIRLTK